jgi:hypothetical protein
MGLSTKLTIKTPEWFKEMPRLIIGCFAGSTYIQIKNILEILQ